jgi:hypothetical protein
VRTLVRVSLVLLTASLVFGWPVEPTLQAQPTKDLTPAEARAIAKEAYVYGFPLVDSYRIQYSYFVDESGPEYKAPWNTLFNNARVYTPEDKAIQTPNSDTPYSYVGADLRAEPLVFTVPAVENGRYYSIQFIDAYTHNFAYVGSRATGNGPGSFLLAGPGWKGNKPEGIKDVLRSETEFVFAFYRTQLFGPADIENVKTVQAGYAVQPLSSFLGEPAPAPAPPIDFIEPLTPEQQRTSPELFTILNFVLRFCPTHPSETELMARFARLGIGAGGTFDAAMSSPELRNAVEAGIADAWQAIAEQQKLIDGGNLTSGDLVGTREHLKNNYLYRMAAARGGIYGNSKEEAMYPAYLVDASGRKLDGSAKYALRFAPGGLPPANAFWSLTMYSLPERYLVANPLDRYLINSPMLPDLIRDADGSITLHVQHESPGEERESNWLPAPKGPFIMAMRLYWPKEEALTGRWTAPPLERVQSEAPLGGAVPVTVENFVRAESDMYFANALSLTGGLARLHHGRDVASPEHQNVIRTNRDTFYSVAVVDLDAGPVTITLPEGAGRFMSMEVINQDHYVPAVVYGAGRYTYAKEQVGTRYVMFGVRTLVDPDDPEDIEKVHALQDAMRIEQRGGPGRFEVPAWDAAGRTKVREALVVLAGTIPDTKRMFGAKGQVDPLRHLLGTATGWGGNPEQDAMYLTVVPPRNDGETIHRLTVENVPVDGFWSITVYNAEGYLETNPYQAYSLNNITAEESPDGSIAVQFGGCDGRTPNCLPIMTGWNYWVRLYRPRKEILDGTWQFPEAQPVN